LRLLSHNSNNEMHYPCNCDEREGVIAPVPVIQMDKVLRVLLTALLIIMVGSNVMANEAQPVKMVSTISSGNFDDYLMLAVDDEGKSISGYYNDGLCRIAFHGALTPITLYQRSDFGEAYEVDAWDPKRPDRRFTTVIYSRAIGSYRDQLTLEPSQDRESSAKECRHRITLDRSNSVSQSFIGVGVVRTPNAPLFQIMRSGDSPKRSRDKLRLPPPNTGVWISRTYLPAAATKGFVYLNWYSPPGTPHGGYVRQRDLYPMPTSR
jgi:hypothetical protein